MIVPLDNPSLAPSSSLVRVCFAFADFNSSMNTLNVLLSLSRRLNKPKEEPNHCNSWLTLCSLGFLMFTIVILCLMYTIDSPKECLYLKLCRKVYILVYITSLSLTLSQPNKRCYITIKQTNNDI